MHHTSEGVQLATNEADPIKPNFAARRQPVACWFRRVGLGNVQVSVLLIIAGHNCSASASMYFVDTQPRRMAGVLDVGRWETQHSGLC